MIRVLLADDHGLVRMGIKRLLQDAHGIKVVGEASSGEQLVSLAKDLNPDVVVTDVNMPPGFGGLEAIKKMIRYNPDLKVLVLTVYGEEPYPTRLLQAGAIGYLTKGCEPEEMIRAIKVVYSGQTYISPQIAQQIAAQRFTKRDHAPIDSLSSRELQIMLMITQGQKVQEISKKLSLSPKTVNSYRYRIFEKLQINSDVELTLMAVRLGMIEGSKSEANEGGEK